MLALRLSLAVLCAGLLLMALAIHVALPAQRELAALVAGAAALIVSGFHAADGTVVPPAIGPMGKRTREVAR